MLPIDNALKNMMRYNQHDFTGSFPPRRCIISFFPHLKNVIDLFKNLRETWFITSRILNSGQIWKKKKNHAEISTFPIDTRVIIKKSYFLNVSLNHISHSIIIRKKRLSVLMTMFIWHM